MFTDCQSSCGIIGFSIKAFCHKRNRITYALSREANDVRKNFSVSVVMRIAFGMTLATFSLPFPAKVANENGGGMREISFVL